MPLFIPGGAGEMTTRRIAYSGAVAALYAGVTIALAPISYGPVQFRISEVLCILPFFFPWSSWGLFIGCIIADLLSSYGIADIIFGSAATLISSLIVARLGARGGTGARICAVCMPPLFNGLLIGGVIAYMTSPGAFFASLIINGASVALGEAAVMFILALPLSFLFPKTALYRFLKNSVGF